MENTITIKPVFIAADKAILEDTIRKAMFEFHEKQPCIGLDVSAESMYESKTDGTHEILGSIVRITTTVLL